MGVFCEEGVDQAPKRAVRDGKGEPAHFTQRRKVDAKTQRKTLRLSLTLRLCVKLFSVLIEEDLQVPSHVGFVEGMFAGRRLPRGRTIVRFGQQQLVIRGANPKMTDTRTREAATTHEPVTRRPRPSRFNK